MFKKIIFPIRKDKFYQSLALDYKERGKQKRKGKPINPLSLHWVTSVFQF